MFENRSFDHMLGHLSLEGIMNDIDGYKKPIGQNDNLYKGGNYSIYNFGGDRVLPFDLPHEWDYVAMQLAKNEVTKRYTMSKLTLKQPELNLILKQNQWAISVLHKFL